MNINITCGCKCNNDRMKHIVEYADRYLCYIISFLGSVLMIIRCFNNDFWVDESYTINATRTSVGLEVLTCDLSCPPIFFVILKFFTNILGSNKFVYHFTSVIPFLVLIVFCMTKVKRRFGGLSASVFAFLLCFHPESATYFVEVRPYAWSSLFVFICFWEGYELIETKGEIMAKWLLFCLFGLLSAYSHYWAFGSVIVIYLCVCIVLSYRNHKNIVKSVILCTISLLLYFPWIGIFLGSLTGMSKDFWISETVPLTECIEFIWCSPILTLVYYITIVYVVVTTLKIINIRFSNDTLQISVGGTIERISSEKIMLMIITIVIVAVYTVEKAYGMLIHPLFVTRYLFPLAPSAWLSFAVILNWIKTDDLKKLVFVSVICSALISYFPRYAYIALTETVNDIATKKTINMIDDLCDDKAIFLTNIEHLEHGVIEYYFPDCNQFLLDYNDELNGNNYLYLTDCDIDEIDDQKNYFDENGYTYIYLGDGYLSKYKINIYRLISDSN